MTVSYSEHFVVNEITNIKIVSIYVRTNKKLTTLRISMFRAYYRH